MKLDLRRVILYVDDLKAMSDFYENKLGLKVLGREDDFVDFDAGGAKLALQAGVSNPGRTKVCFYAADVSKARQELIDRGVRMGREPGAGDAVKICDGKDPEGNTFQLSNRA
jgi:catechol 2,3-dioxygenase-like lactoylglutathione lyase family enzyme